MGVSFFGNAWFAFLNLIFTPVYFSYLGAEGYGLIGLYSSIYAITSLLDLGIANSLNHKLSSYANCEKKDFAIFSFLKTIEILYIIFSSFICLVIFVGSEYLSMYWLNPKVLGINEIESCIKYMSLAILFQLPISLYQSGYFGLNQHTRLTLINILILTLKFAGTFFIFYFFSSSITTFFQWQLLITIIQVVLLSVDIRKQIVKSGFSNKESQINFKQLKGETTEFAIGSAGISLTEFLLYQLDKIILSNLLTLEQYGYYNLAFTIASITTLFIRPICNVAFPKFVAIFKEDKIPSVEFKKYSEFLAILLIPLSIYVSVFAKEILYIWSNQNLIVDNCFQFLQIMVIGNLFYGLNRPSIILGLANNNTRITIKHQMGLIILQLLILSQTSQIGPLSGAISWMSVNCFFFIVSKKLILNGISKELGLWSYKMNIKNVVLVTLLVTMFNFIYVFIHINFILYAIITLTILVSICFIFSNLKKQVIVL